MGCIFAYECIYAIYNQCLALPLMFLEGNKWSEGSVKFSGFDFSALALIPHISQIVCMQLSQKMSPLAFSNTIYLATLHAESICHFNLDTVRLSSLSHFNAHGGWLGQSFSSWLH